MLPISNVAVTAPCGGSRPLGQRTLRAKRVPSFQFSMPMKHGEELWVGVGNSEPETSNPEPETKISILQDSKSRLAFSAYFRYSIYISNEFKESKMTLAFIQNMGPVQILICIAVILFLFGGKKIPELARSLGKAKNEFKKGLEEGKKESEAAEESKKLEEQKA